jgi:hypothetical protein
MRKDRREKLYRDLRAPGTRRVVEALELVREEMTEFEDDLPKMPAGVLMKNRRDEGGRLGQ